MIKFAILLFACATTVLSIRDNEVLEELSDPSAASVVPDWQILGTIGEKTYYVDHNSRTTWTGARNLCESANMTLATIETLLENNFLALAHLTTDKFDQTYWFAARDSHKLSQFSWGAIGSNGEDIDVDIELHDMENKPYRTCGAVRSMVDWYGTQLRMLKCNVAYTTVYQICEKKMLK